MKLSSLPLPSDGSGMEDNFIFRRIQYRERWFKDCTNDVGLVFPGFQYVGSVLFSFQYMPSGGTTFCLAT